MLLCDAVCGVLEKKKREQEANAVVIGGVPQPAGTCVAARGVRLLGGDVTRGMILGGPAPGCMARIGTLDKTLVVKLQIEGWVRRCDDARF